MGRAVGILVGLFALTACAVPTDPATEWVSVSGRAGYGVTSVGLLAAPPDGPLQLLGSWEIEPTGSTYFDFTTLVEPDLCDFLAVRAVACDCGLLGGGNPKVSEPEPLGGCGVHTDVYLPF